MSEVTIIRQSQVNSYYLAAFLRFKLGQMQIERFITGATGQLRLYATAVAQFWVPMLKADQQLEFEHAAEASKEAKKRAFYLLEAAKRAVEIAIQESKAAALKYLKSVVT